MRSTGRTNRGAWLGLALLALGLIGAAPKPSQAADTPWLGVTMQTMDDGLREGMSYQGTGVLVNRVVSDSPAERAGLRKGDVIVRIGGRSVESPDEVTRIVHDSRVGQTITLTIDRDGDRRSLTARLGSRSENDADRGDADTRLKMRRDSHNDSDMESNDDQDSGDVKDFEDMKDFKDMKDMKDMKELKDLPRKMDMGNGMRGFMINGVGRGRLGVRAEDLSSDLAPYFDAPEGSGSVVMEVLKDTPAERAGIKPGDVIVRVGDQKISDTEDLVQTLRDVPEGRVSVTVIRKGTRRTFEPVLEAAPRAYRFDSRGPMSFGPGNRRMIVRDKNGTRTYGDMGNRDDELKQLREEVRRLREQLKERDDKNNNDDDNND